MSRNEWKSTEIGASKVGNFSPFSCPGDLSVDGVDRVGTLGPGESTGHLCALFAGGLRHRTLVARAEGTVVASVAADALRALEDSDPSFFSPASLRLCFVRRASLTLSRLPRAQARPPAPLRARPQPHLQGRDLCARAVARGATRFAPRIFEIAPNRRSLVETSRGRAAERDDAFHPRRWLEEPSHAIRTVAVHDERVLGALERRGEAVLEATGNGAVVFGRDDAPEAIFVVLEGEVVLDPAPEGFCVLGRGTVLGGLEFLTRDDAYGVSCLVASETARLARLDRRALAEAGPAAADVIRAAASAAEPTVRRWARYGLSRRFCGAGEPLCRSGDEATAAFLVLAGRVRCTHFGEKRWHAPPGSPRTSVRRYAVWK